MTVAVQVSHCAGFSYRCSVIMTVAVCRFGLQVTGV